MFEQFPYTNYHDLNLDWIIQRVKEAYGPDNPPTDVVYTVNGENGNVVLYRDPIIQFPDTDEHMWNMFRLTDGFAMGVQFEEGKMVRIAGNDRFDVYDENNEPPYPVTSVNGHTGAVTIPVPVQSVNGLTGNVILYQNAIVRFPDLPSTDSWEIKRKTEGNTDSGITFNEGAAAERIDGDAVYEIYDEGNPPPYPVTSVGTLTGDIAILNTEIVTDQGTQKLRIIFPVTSVDGETGTVKTWANSANPILKTPQEADGDSWGIVREMLSGDCGISFEYDDLLDEVSGYLTFNDGVNTPLKVKILTPNDIPSSSGVVSVNGLAGVVNLTGSNIPVSSQDSTKIDAALSALGAKTGADIPVSSQDSTKIDAALSALTTKDGNIDASLAIVETGNTASQNISKDKFVIWKDHAYTAKVNITQDDTFVSGTNLQPVTDGMINALLGITDTLNSNVAMKDKLIEHASSVTHSYTISGAGSCLLCISGNGGTRTWVGYIRATSNGNVSAFDIVKGDNTSISVSSGTLTVTFDSASYAYARVIYIHGVQIA